MTALNIMPEYAEAYMNLGILYHLNDDSKNAILNFRKALEIGTKQDDLIYNNLGMVYGEMGDNKTAIEMFERALTSEVKVLPIYRNIAQTYIAMGDYPAAIETYKKAISNHPTSRVLYAEMLLNTKKISEEEDDVAVADSLIQKGVVAEDLEEFDETIIDEYNRKDPKIVEDYLELGKVYETTGAVEEAAESYMKAIDYAQDKSSYYNKLGVLYARNALYDQAYDAFNAAVEHEPGNKEARDNLAQCQRMLTEHSEK